MTEILNMQKYQMKMFEEIFGKKEKSSTEEKRKGVYRVKLQKFMDAYADALKDFEWMWEGKKKPSEIADAALEVAYSTMRVDTYVKTLHALSDDLKKELMRDNIRSPIPKGWFTKNRKGN